MTLRKLTILFVGICSLNAARAQKILNEQAALDKFNSAVVRVNIWWLSRAPSARIKLDGVVIIDTTNTAHLENTFFDIRLLQGTHTLSLSNTDNTLVSLQVFAVQNEIKFKLDTSYKFCNLIIVGYLPKLLPVPNYRQRTIESEYQQKIRDLNLNDKNLQATLRKRSKIPLKEIMERIGATLEGLPHIPLNQSFAGIRNKLAIMETFRLFI